MSRATGLPICTFRRKFSYKISVNERDVYAALIFFIVQTKLKNVHGFYIFNKIPYICH